MHTIGKVFLGLIVVFLVPAAVLLTARLINTRNHWMQQVATERTAVEQNAEQLEEKERTLDQLQADLARQRLSWDTVIPAPNSAADAQGLLTVGAGPQQGLGIPEGGPAPIVHAFMPLPEGGSLYVGPFQVVAAQGNQAQLKPMFSVFPGETANWTRGVWRLWRVIPSQAPSRVVALTNEIVKANEALATRQSTLQIQTQAVAQARATLESRQRELLGNPQAPEIEGSPEVTAGLVAALQQADAARNAELAKLDQMRRAVDQAYQRLKNLVAQNENLAGKLTSQSASGPGPTLDVSTAR